MSKKFKLPTDLTSVIDQKVYTRWLQRKAAAHVKRDRQRCDHPVTGSRYRELIHEAVCQSAGLDHYTGEYLEWSLISTYDNVKSKAGRTAYKSGFALMPTVDHVMRSDGQYEFVICGWRTNDAKSDLSHEEFIAICRRVVKYHDAKVTT